MTHELTMVVYVAIILLLMIVVDVLVGLKNNGLVWGSSARDSAAKPSLLHGRTSRAVRNHVEALCMFVPVVLVLNAAGISNEATVLWTMIFVISRVAYAIIYWLGLPWIRTLVWALGVIATVILFTQAL